LEDIRNHAAQLLQKKYRVFLLIRYSNMLKYKEISFLYSSLKGFGLIAKKTRKKSRFLIAKFLHFVKNEFNFKLYITRFYSKVIRIQRFFREKDKRNKEKMGILKDLWDKCVIKLIKNEIEEAHKEKKSKKTKKKPEKDVRKQKKLQGITKELKEKTLLGYFQGKLNEYRAKIRAYMKLMKGLNHEQMILTAFLRNSSSSKRNSIFVKEKTGEEIKENIVNYVEMNEKCCDLKSLKKPDFEFLPKNEEMERMVEEALEKVSL